MNNQLNVSLSPHIRGKETTRKLMYGVVIALIPTVIASVIFFGIGAIITISAAVISCVTIEYLVQRYLFKKPATIGDGSALVTGLLLGLILPSSIPVYQIVTGSILAIGVTKLTYGGLGNNIFNPALVGRTFMLISFPTDMTLWPVPKGFATGYFDAATGATPLAVIKDGINNGLPVSELMDRIPTFFDLLFGNMGGSIGEVSAIAILIGFAYMLYKRIITWHIPVAVIGSLVLFTSIFWIINPEIYVGPAFHVLSGGVLIGAIFMATDYVTSPMIPKSMIIYGCGIGILTAIIRIWGSYPEGIMFAILIMNAFVPLLNAYIKPKRFGEEVKNG